MFTSGYVRARLVTTIKCFEVKTSQLGLSLCDTTINVYVGDESGQLVHIENTIKRSKGFFKGNKTDSEYLAEQNKEYLVMLEKATKFIEEKIKLENTFLKV